MGVLKTLLVGTLAVLGGCTVVVGGCTVGATKAGLETLDTMASVAEKNHFNKLYKQNPARAEAKYQDVAAKCYDCLLYTSPSPRDQRGSRMPSSA